MTIAAKSTGSAWRERAAVAPTTSPRSSRPLSTRGRTSALGREAVHVGFWPIIVVDADKILRELPGAHVLHIVRNPWSAYADTRKRPVPLSLASYMLGWTLNQYYALFFRRQFPERMHIVRTEDVLADPQGALGGICEKLGLEVAATLRTPTFNGSELAEVYPWGTLRRATPDANRATALELTPAERDEIECERNPTSTCSGISDWRRNSSAEPGA
jgi:hypothetical protein